MTVLPKYLLMRRRMSSIIFSGRNGALVWLRPTQHVCLGGLEAISPVQSLSHVGLFETPWTAARQASLSFTISQSFLKLYMLEEFNVQQSMGLQRFGHDRRLTLTHRHTTRTHTHTHTHARAHRHTQACAHIHTAFSVSNVTSLEGPNCLSSSTAVLNSQRSSQDNVLS